MPLHYVKHELISLKAHPDFSEVWLHGQISNDTSILGLGDLRVIGKELVQFAGGRLDMLLADTDNEIRYEVEIMLGATDPSHLVRTLEYWDLQRRHYPAYEHVAVLVAEDVTARFFNVIALFAGFIPIIAIQLNALKVDDRIVLNFVKVLDQRQLQADDTDIREEGEEVDRSMWEARVGATMMKLCDRVAQVANEVAEPKLVLKYKKSHVALCVLGSFFNVLSFFPKKDFVPVRLSVSEPEHWIARLGQVGIEAELKKHGSRVQVRLRTGDIEQHEMLLRELIHEAVKQSQQ
jgi:hypothetical protein